MGVYNGLKMMVHIHRNDFAYGQVTVSVFVKEEMLDWQHIILKKNINSTFYHVDILVMY